MNHYRKPRPDCPHCEGSGRIVVETCSAAGGVLSTRYIRCICTDADQHERPNPDPDHPSAGIPVTDREL